MTGLDRSSFVTLCSALEQRAEQHPDRLALRFGKQHLSFAELQVLINRTANALLGLGVEPGAKVALMLPNGPEFVACWLALACLGATLVPINTRLKGDLLDYQLGHAEVDLAVVGARQLASFEAAGPPRPRGPSIVAGAETEPPPGWLRLENLLESAAGGSPPRIELPPDGLAMIMYTSGTTGRPKGVQIGRQAQLKHGLNYTELLGIQPAETAYVYLPLFHVTAMGSTLGSLLGGASVALDDGFNPFGFWERTRRYRAVVFTFVGSVLAMLYHRPPRPDDPDNPVRRAVGAATPTWLWRDFERRFGLEIVETYGQTEMAALWFMPPLPSRKVGTVGLPVPGRFEARIVAKDGRELPAGERGEIAIKPADPGDMMSGYYRDPESTAAAPRSDGWYYTGDLGVRDAEGYYTYLGRLKDCIRRRGENIAAFEIERVVNGLPGVVESAAVGVPSELGEEDVKLCVVPRPESRLQPHHIWAQCRARLPSFMVPRWIQIRTALPRTATERVRKPDLVVEGTAGCWQAGDES
jgi:crotonobetaine/carnitine-CoA ligase